MSSSTRIIKQSLGLCVIFSTLASAAMRMREPFCKSSDGSRKAWITIQKGNVIVDLMKNNEILRHGNEIAKNSGKRSGEGIWGMLFGKTPIEAEAEKIAKEYCDLGMYSTSNLSTGSFPLDAIIKPPSKE